MSSPFDQLASSYQAVWSDSRKGRSQRDEVWQEIDLLFRSGDRVLDLGCGTGDDAVHLSARGIEVVGIDSSSAMVEVARGRGVDAHLRRVEDLATLTRSFSGVLSNFGALNCVGELGSVAAELRRLVQPGGMVALCVMGRFSWRETLRYLVRLNVPKAVRRWAGRTSWRGITIRYWSAAEMRGAFGGEFVFEKRCAVGGGDHQLYVFRARGLR